MKKIIIGIDISSKTLDICVKKGHEVKHSIIENEVKAIKAFFKRHAKEEVIVAMENTGRYNWNLFEVLPGLSFKVYVIPPLHLKKSLGLVRGKNDKIDALRICSFIEKNSEETLLWKPTSVAVKRLKILLTERNSRIKMKKQLVKQQHDYKLMKTISLDKELLKLNKKMIEVIDGQISKIESDIEKIIQFDDQMKAQSELIRSVPGPRKMACVIAVLYLLIFSPEPRSGTNLRCQFLPIKA